MKITFELDTARDDYSPLELNRITKAVDMALCLHTIRELIFKDNLAPDTVGAAFEAYDIDLDTLID